MTKKLSKLMVLMLLMALVFTSVGVSLALAQDGKDGNFQKDLQLNMKNGDVANLQKELAKQGLFKVTATGVFGPLTEKAVKQFQKKQGLEETGRVDAETRAVLNKLSVNKGPSVNSGKGNANANAFGAEAMKKIQELMDKIKKLEEKLALAQAALLKQEAVVAEPVAEPVKLPKATSTPEQAAAGIIIHGGVSGPGYPTGPLSLSLINTTLLFDRIGAVKEGIGSLEIKDRQYEAPLETIPPTMGAFPVMINGVANTATQVKVISNLKTQNGVGQHSGTIDIDIDTVPAGHVTLAYDGTATVVGSTITSKGTFKTAKTTGIFAGLVANGTYNMTILESGTMVGSPVTLNLTTVSQ